MIFARAEKKTKNCNFVTSNVLYDHHTAFINADAIAAATVQTSAVIVYTLYDSSWSQDSCIRTSKSDRVVYNDSFLLVNVKC